LEGSAKFAFAIFFLPIREKLPQPMFQPAITMPLLLLPCFTSREVFIVRGVEKRKNTIHY
jgi:hypothetical protein